MASLKGSGLLLKVLGAVLVDSGRGLGAILAAVLRCPGRGYGLGSGRGRFRARFWASLFSLLFLHCALSLLSLLT